VKENLGLFWGGWQGSAKSKLSHYCRRDREAIFVVRKEGCESLLKLLRSEKNPRNTRKKKKVIG